MIIPARLFPKYIESADYWELRGPSGQKHGIIDRARLHEYSFLPDYVEGIGSNSRLRFVKLRVPYAEMQDVIDRARFEQEKAEFDLRHSKRIPAPTRFCVAEFIGQYRVYRHVAYRCSSMRPDLPPVRIE